MKEAIIQSADPSGSPAEYVIEVCGSKAADWSGVVSRLAWALAPFLNYRVKIWGVPEPLELNVPEEFDSSVDIGSILERTRWKEDPHSSLRSGMLRLIDAEGKILKDEVRWGSDSPKEGSDFCNLTYKMGMTSVSELRQRSQIRFSEWWRIWRGRCQGATVLATGPSFEWYKRYDLSDDFVVTCNSAIINSEMMETVRPEAVVFADPIFHFGPSQYAAQFREEVREAADRFDFKILIPELYAFTFLAAMPELEERTIFVPMSTGRELYNFDLSEAFEVKSTKNILTFLMLPVAATFADRIRILGCDGRALENDDYFWGHNRAAQINEKMANIQAVHPGFFAIDYNDYYLDHCRSLEELVKQGEASGKQFESLAPSKIPVLASRAITEELASLVDTATAEALWDERDRRREFEAVRLADVGGKDIGFISVNPSLRSRLGHAIHQDLAFKVEAENQGLGFASLGHSDLIEELRGSFALPVFSVMTVQIARAEIAERGPLASQFVDELFSGLETLSKVSSLEGATVFLYLGHASLLPPLASRLATSRIPFAGIVVNLFSGYFGATNPETADEDVVHAALTAGMVKDSCRLKIVCDSVPLADAFWENSGVRLDVLPMAPCQTLSPTERALEGDQLRVVFPSHAESARGYEILESFAEEYASEFKGDIDFHFRRYAPWRRDLSIGSDSASPNVTWIEGELSDEDYREMMVSADIVLLPYSPEAFRFRTSSILAETFSLGKPVIVVNGSWLSGPVEKTGAGWIMEDLSARELHRICLDLCQKDKSAIRAMEFTATQEWLKQNSIGEMMSVITGDIDSSLEVDPRRILPRRDSAPAEVASAPAKVASAPAKVASAPAKVASAPAKVASASANVLGNRSVEEALKARALRAEAQVERYRRCWSYRTGFYLLHPWKIYTWIRHRLREFRARDQNEVELQDRSQFGGEELLNPAPSAEEQPKPLEEPKYRLSDREKSPPVGDEEKSGLSSFTINHFEDGFPRHLKARLNEGDVVRKAILNIRDQSEPRVCIDVGAHYGSSVRPLLNDGWKVYAFEPDAENRAKLMEGLGKFIPEQLVVEEMAVSDAENEDVSFFRSDVSTGISGLSSFHESHSESGLVSTTTLRKYSTLKEIDRVNLLKIDTEGFDFHVLRGVPWDRWAPDAILCEFEDSKTESLGYRWGEMAQYLADRGYDVWVSEWHPIVEYGKAHDWNRIFRFPGGLRDTESWGNLLAFKFRLNDEVMKSCLNGALKTYGDSK